jgi:hypothetical protein
MPEFINIRGNGADAVTGERCSPGERVFDTGFKNRTAPYMSNHRTRVVKEETIVWLAKEAGIKLCGDECGCKSDGRVSEPAPRVESEDASVGGGEASPGKAKVGRKPAAKRRSSGTTKSK